MQIRNKLFSCDKTSKYKIYNFWGIKFTTKNKNYEYNEHDASVVIQDTLDLSCLEHSKKVIVFLTPGESKICGGIMSIFSLCQASREIQQDAFCCISTFPNHKTYVINDKFYNNERILRFEQITNKAKNAQEIIVHIPEFYTPYFYQDLGKNDMDFLESIPNLQINIMNQNIELMPDTERLQCLYTLTTNITQTIAHNRYCTQEVCDKWHIPTHLFSVNLDLGKYKAYPFKEKEHMIVVSPDENGMKETIINKIHFLFPEWRIITIRDMSFNQYMDYIARGFFSITFGEGMDGYFNQPAYVGGVGFAVYNDAFFPNESWKKLENVYQSYDEMLEKICDDMKILSNNEGLYYGIIRKHVQKLNEIYTRNDYLRNIDKFYKRHYDYVPSMKGVIK